VGVRRTNEVGSTYEIELGRYDIINDGCARDFAEGEPESQYCFYIKRPDGTEARTPTSNYADGGNNRSLGLVLERPAFLAASTADSTTITVYGKIKDYDPSPDDDDETIGEFRVSERYPSIGTGTRILTYKSGGCESRLTMSNTELVAFSPRPASPPSGLRRGRGGLRRSASEGDHGCTRGSRGGGTHAAGHVSSVVRRLRRCASEHLRCALEDLPIAGTPGGVLGCSYEPRKTREDEPNERRHT
jgi:hypothetical protein